MKYLCIVDDIQNYEISDPNIDIYQIYRKSSKIMRIVRYIHHQIPDFFKLKKYWLGEWRSKISTYDKIILFDSIFDYYPLEFIREHNKDCKIMFCYRNRVIAPITHSKIMKNPELIADRYSASLFSYNQDDCHKYNMTYYPQFHTVPKALIDSKFEIKTDLYFIGKDKGRLYMIKDLSEILSKENIRFKFDVIPDKNKNYTLQEKKFLHSPVKYSDVIKNCCKSKCILELVTSTNRGITYRVLESIILKRKLLTNNIDLANEDIFDKDNMFILGIHDINHLSDFIRSPYKDNHNDKNINSFQEFCHNLFNSNI